MPNANAQERGVVAGGPVGSRWAGRLRIFRSEAVRAGFSHCWHERDYDTLVQVAERLPETVLEEDQQLLMYYHNASLRVSNQPRQERLI